jgi:aspartate kinase
MKVFKFGGASLANHERVQHIGNLMRSFTGEKIVVIISAAGKTTNALEKVAEAFFEGKKEQALALFEGIKHSHINLAKYLLVKTYNDTLEQLVNFFTEVEWMLHDKPVRAFEYYYDQIVCTGELLSSSIVSAYFNETGKPNQWLDVRDIIRTDNSFREAEVDWAHTSRMVNSSVIPALIQQNIIITQGFIGATDENESTTLGREGSDFTAAVFANILNAESLTIWKDVEGVMDADPGQFPEAAWLPQLNYHEAVEMSFYGAKIIHPKTIRPLQQKDIPLYVKSFTNPEKPGTLVSRKTVKGLPPLRIIKEKQALVYLQSRELSFINEGIAEIFFSLLKEYHITPSLVQTGALGLVCCIDDNPDHIGKLAAAASELYDVQVEKGLTLLTVLHANKPLFQKMILGKEVVLTLALKGTMHALWKEE